MSHKGDETMRSQEGQAIILAVYQGHSPLFTFLVRQFNNILHRVLYLARINGFEKKKKKSLVQEMT
jgi:hypothetical protein